MSTFCDLAIHNGGFPMPVKRVFQRLYHSSVVWSWAFNFVRLASAMVLLPLVLRPGYLSVNDLGMYWVFADLSALAVLFDFGFSPSVARNAAYAMAGAHELRAEGHADTEAAGQPNYPLLWQLLDSTRHLFLYLSGGALVLLGLVGTMTVGSRVDETSHPAMTWIAWGLVLVSATLEIYAGWWNTFLRGLNLVLLSARISVLSYGLRIVLAAILLISGAGLMALPIALLVGSMLQRTLSRRCCLRALGNKPAHLPKSSLIPVLWPNSWRTGLQFLSVYLATKVNTLLCSHFIGLGATAGYGLTVQVTSLIGSMAMVWMAVKWPLLGQYCKLQDFTRLRAVLWSRMWLQALTFVVLAAVAIFLGPIVLKWIGSNKQLMPTALFLGLLAYSFLELQFALWTTLLSLIRNQIPSLWPTVITNLITLTTVLVLMQFLGPRPEDTPEQVLRNVLSALALQAPHAPDNPAQVEWAFQGIKVLVFAPLIIGSLFNFWFWPLVGARSIGTRWLKFVMTGGGTQTAARSRPQGGS